MKALNTVEMQNVNAGGYKCSACGQKFYKKFLYKIWIFKFYTREAGAIFERRIGDTRYTIAYYNTLEAGAIFERIRADTLYYVVAKVDSS